MEYYTEMKNKLNNKKLLFAITRMNFIDKVCCQENVIRHRSKYCMLLLHRSSKTVKLCQGDRN